MWKIEEIKQKQEYVRERLNHCTDPKEKEKLELSLITYNELLSNSGTLRYTRIPNLLDKLTKDNFSNKKEKDLARLEVELFFGDEAYISDEYLNFLLQLCDRVSEREVPELDEALFVPMVVTKESLIELSKKFYASLQDEEILELASKVLNDESSMNFSHTARRGRSDCKGLTLNDYIFDKSYINVTSQNNIFDYQVFNHEVMHGIDFYMRKKVPSENYYGFHEVPTYTIDYLFLDYLEENGLAPNQVQMLRCQKDNYLHLLATLTKTQIRSQLIREYGVKNSKNPSMDQIRKILTVELKKQLLEIQAGIMAYGLKEQIRENKKIGISHLKQFMRNTIPKDQTPYFSYIGLSNDELLKYSEQIGNYSMQSQDHISVKGK